MEQCNPQWSSTPRSSYQLYNHLKQLANVTLITHERNQKALTQNGENGEIHYTKESILSKVIYKIAKLISGSNRTIWPIRQILAYPVYAEFNWRVNHAFSKKVKNGEYDVVLCTTPLSPRYPSEISKHCKETPFVIGPVNGGSLLSRRRPTKEKNYFSRILRSTSHLLPNYKNTYKHATKVLAGSRQTYTWLQYRFNLSRNKIELLFENGVNEELYENKIIKRENNSTFNIISICSESDLKNIDITLNILKTLPDEVRLGTKIKSICEDPNCTKIKKLIQQHKAEKIVSLILEPDDSTEISKEYENTHLMVDLSIKTKNNARIMEAMACGLPCVISNHTNTQDLVSESAGYQIDMQSREVSIEKVKKIVTSLYHNESQRLKMAEKNRSRSKIFSWSHKAICLVNILNKTIAQTSANQK